MSAIKTLVAMCGWKTAEGDYGKGLTTRDQSAIDHIVNNQLSNTTEKLGDKLYRISVWETTDNRGRATGNYMAGIFETDQAMVKDTGALEFLQG